MRVLIDASVLLRALLPSANPARAVDVILAAAFARAYTLLLPEPLLAELTTKAATDPYLAARIPAERARAFASALVKVGVPLPPLSSPLPPLTRDPGDDYLLAYALRDHADYLVPGIAPVLIVDPGAFVRELRARGLVDH